MTAHGTPSKDADAGADAGFSLAEVLVALAILMAAFAGLAGSSIAALRSVQHDKAQTRALDYAAQVMERFRTAPWTDLVDTSVSPVALRSATLPSALSAGAPSSTAVQSATLRWVDDNANACQTPSTIANGRDYLRLDLVVVWTDRAGKQRSTSLSSYRVANRSEQQPALGTATNLTCGVPS